MTNLLIINSSALGEASASRQLTRELAERAQALQPSLHIIERDIGSNPPPHLVPATVLAVRGVADTDEQRAALALSDSLVAELQAADTLVIGAPMYNFGIPSTLKAWFDHVLRVGVTFRYSAEGPEGLLQGKRAIVILTRGGLYSEGPAQALDAQEPHIRTMLGFVGITDVHFIRAEKLAMGDEARAAAIEAALTEIEGCAQAQLALAA